MAQSKDDARAARVVVLEQVQVKLNKQYGSDGRDIVRRGNKGIIRPMNVISTQCLPLNMALGCGGWPRGRIAEVYGGESVGKSTLTLHAIAETQRMGGIAVLIDAEHALDVHYAEKLGVDVDSLFINQPDSAEEAVDVVEAYAAAGVDLIVVDSVAALVPQAELEGGASKQHVGAQARMMSAHLRRLSGVIAKQDCVVIYTNQLREKVNTMGHGSPTTTPGGRALKFYASIRVNMQYAEKLIDASGVVYGIRTYITVVKNKVAPPYRETSIDIVFGKGMVREINTLEYAISLGLVQRKGAYYNPDIANPDFKVQGSRATAEWLASNPDKLSALESMAIDVGLLTGPVSKKKKKKKGDTEAKEEETKTEEGATDAESDE